MRYKNQPAPTQGPAQPLQGHQLKLPQAPLKVDLRRLHNEPIQSPSPSRSSKEEVQIKAEPKIKLTPKLRPRPTPSPKQEPPDTEQQPPARNSTHSRKKLRRLGPIEESNV
jgi:hypothetical protein